MLIIPVKEGENIERAIKRYKKKYSNTQVVKQLRDRRYFTKPSVVNREMRLKAAYKEQMFSEEA